MGTIYGALDTVLLVATGSGQDWQVTERLGGHDIQCLAAARAAPDRVLCGTFDAGLQRSDDGGQTWDRVGTERLPERVMAVAVSPHDPADVWAGTEPSAVFRSTDGGVTWTERPGLTDLPSAEEWYFPPRPETHHVRWIEVDPANADRLYIGIEAGAFVRSTDGGATWEERPPGARLDNHSMATHPKAPGRVYAAAGDGYAESHDGGASFDHPQAGLEHRYCWSIAPDPANPDCVVLSAASGPRAAHSQPAESYVYRRRPDDPWELAMEGLPSPEGSLRAVLTPGTAAGEVFLLSNHGFYRTADAGSSWHSLAIPWDDTYTDQRPRGLAIV